MFERRKMGIEREDFGEERGGVLAGKAECILETMAAEELLLVTGQPGGRLLKWRWAGTLVKTSVKEEYVQLRIIPHAADEMPRKLNKPEGRDHIQSTRGKKHHPRKRESSQNYSPLLKIISRYSYWDPCLYLRWCSIHIKTHTEIYTSLNTHKSILLIDFSRILL